MVPSIDQYSFLLSFCVSSNGYWRQLYRRYFYPLLLIWYYHSFLSYIHVNIFVVETKSSSFAIECFLQFINDTSCSHEGLFDVVNDSCSWPNTIPSNYNINLKGSDNVVYSTFRLQAMYTTRDAFVHHTLIPWLITQALVHRVDQSKWLMLPTPDLPFTTGAYILILH